MPNTLLQRMYKNNTFDWCGWQVEKNYWCSVGPSTYSRPILDYPSTDGSCKILFYFLLVTFNYLCLQMLLLEIGKEKNGEDGIWFLDQSVRCPGSWFGGFCGRLWDSLWVEPLWDFQTLALDVSNRKGGRLAQCKELSLEFVLLG